MKILYCIAAIFFATPQVLRAQQPLLKFEHITREDGLANTVVRHVLQDADGFLWLATDGGLHRSDGYTVKVYRNQPGDSTTLSNNLVTRIFEDHTGTLWAATNGALNRLDKSKDSFRQYREGLGKPDLFRNKKVTSIIEDDEGFLWLALTGIGVIRFDPRNEIFDSPAEAFNVSLGKNKVINSLFKDFKGNFWIGTSKGLTLFNKTQGKFHQFTTQGLMDVNITSLAGDGKGNLWIGTTTGLAFAQIQSDSVVGVLTYGKGAEMANNEVNDVLQDKSGTVWIASRAGLTVFNPARQTMQKVFHDDANSFSIIGNSCNSLLEDRQGIIWIGTEAGVSKFDSGRFPFRLFNTSTGFPANNINAIEADRYGILWIGTDEGLVRMDKKSNSIISVSAPEILRTRITRIVNDKAGWLWIATENALHHYNKGQNIETLADINGKQILSLAVDGENSVWIGTSSSLYKYNPKNYPLALVSSPLINEPVQCILYDRTNEIWVGTDRKLVRISKDGQGKIATKVYTHKNDNPATVSFNNITALYQAKDGKIWVGTQGGGLNYFNEATESFTQFSWDDGLPSDNIRGIEGDEKGNLWVSTDKGLCRFDPLRRLFTNFDRSDGLQSNVFNPGAVVRTNSGELFFGGIKGMNSVDADSIKTTLAAPKVLINDFQIRYKSVRPGSKKLPKMVSETEEIEISHSDRVITFGFVGINHRDPMKNRYAYKLENFEEDWNYTNADKRFATYTNLSSGKYNFVVKCMNTDGVWSNETSIKLIISPPFWKTWWFYLVCAVVLGAAGLAYYVRKKNELEFVKNILEQQIQRRTTELKKEKERVELANREIEILKKQIDGLKK